MKGLTLERQEFSREFTLGSFYYDGDFICYSLERAWRDNKPNISCIPEGEYKFNFHLYHGKLETVALVGETVSHYPSEKVRNLILLHPANHYDELQGCIAMGLEKDSGLGKVINSHKAFNKLRNVILSKNIESINIV